MFSTTAASAVSKIFDIVEPIASELERAGFNLQRGFSKRWWVGECGISIKCQNENVLWLGVWTPFWKDHGCPLCIAVHDGVWHPAIIARFKNMFPSHVIYPPNDTYRFLTKCIDQHLLMVDAVRDISDWLLQGYLNGICTLVAANQPSTDQSFVQSANSLE